MKEIHKKDKEKENLVLQKQTYLNHKLKVHKMADELPKKDVKTDR